MPTVHIPHVEQRLDVFALDAQPVTDESGFVHIPAILTRVGVFPYQNVDGSVRMELRHPDDVMDAVSIETLMRKPVVDNHPPFGPVTPDTAKKFTVGFTGDDVKGENGEVKGKITLLDVDVIAAATREDSPKTELSCGYGAEITREDGVFQGMRYDSRQRKIRYNHVAIVDKGRMGPNVKLKLDKACTGVFIADGLGHEVEFTTDTEEVQPMKIQFNLIARAFDAFRLDSATVEVDESAKPAITLLMDREANLAAHAIDLEQKLDKLQGEHDVAVAQLKTATERADEAEKRPKTEDLALLVKERASLIESAKQAKVEVADEDENIDIKRNIVAKVSGIKGETLADKSKDYIDASYDAAMRNSSQHNKGMTNLADVGGLGGTTEPPKTVGDKAPVIAINSRAAYIKDRQDRSLGKTETK